MTENDELRCFEDALGFDGITSELNVLPGLWTARVTSHVSIDGVDAGITRANVVEAGRLLDRVLPKSGLGPPRIGVCRTQSARGGRTAGSAVTNWTSSARRSATWSAKAST